MQKLLIIHSSGANSGGEAISFKIYQGLKDFFNFTFFVPQIELESKFKVNAPIFYPPKNDLLQTIKTLKQVIKTVNPEIIHAHGTRAAFFLKIALIGIKNKPKFLYTIHGFHIFHKKNLKAKIFLFIEQLTNKFFVNKIICVGKDDFEVVKKISSNKQDVVLIKNGINSINKTVDEELQNIKNKNQFLIGTICRLHYQKDIESLIKSAQIIKNDAVIVIIGSGPDEKKLKELTKQLNLEGKIIFLGNKNKAATLLHYFDVFVLSTRWEGLPLVILEAMLAKVPVIGSRVHGVKELVVNNKTGFLFEQGNYVELGQKINYVLENKNNLTNIIDEAYNIARNEYSEEKMVAEYKKLYLE